MSAISTANLLAQPELANQIIGAVETASIFQGLVKPERLTREGIVIQSMGQTLASFVGEGAPKPVNNPDFSEFSMKPFKLAKIVYMTTESKDDHNELERLLLTEAAGSLGRTFDAAVLDQVVSRPVGFDTIAAATGGTQVITDYVSFIQATAPQNGHKVEAIVLNEELLTLFKMVVDGNGLPLLLITDSKINGVDYRIVDTLGVEPIGYAGPFKTRAHWGFVPGSIKLKYSEEASIMDNGVRVDLWQENKVAYLVEASFGFKVKDLSDFRKLEAVAPVVAP